MIIIIYIFLSWNAGWLVHQNHMPPMTRLVAHSRSVFNCLLLINKNQFLFWENECDFYCCAVLCMSWQDHYDWVKRAGCLSLKRIMSRSFAIWLSDLQRALQPEPSSKPFNQSRQTALRPVAKGYVPYGAGRGFAGDRCSAWRKTARHGDLTTTMQHFCSPRISSVTPDRLRAAICPFISSELTRAFAEGSMGQVVQLNKWALVKYGAFSHIQDSL